jgi:N-acetylmuramoyl-L-alanine amidase CwlA
VDAVKITGFKQAGSGNYRAGRTAPIRYIVVHYTANKGDTAKNNADYFARATTKTSAHYFVDEKEVWQSVREMDTAYHCGAKTYKHPFCRNGNSIGVEMCLLDKSGNIRPGTIDTALSVVRQLMAAYDIPIDRVLRHYDVTGKNCPRPMVENPQLWEDFKKELEGVDTMLDYPEWARKTYHWYDDMPEWARASVQKAVKKGIVSANGDNSVTVLGCNLQPIVFMDRAGMLD